jgi:peptidoglycan/LPS O-acetylase OafA/YrhL
MAGFSMVSLFALAGLYYATGQPSIGSGISSYGLLRCSLEFLVGASLCRIYLTGQMTFRWWPVLLFTGFLALVVLYSFGPVTDYLVMPAAFALLILCLALAGEGAVPLLRDRVLVFLGTISYSTYLAHYFILDWVKFLFVQNDDPPLSVGIIFIAATLAASIILYFCVEVPGRRLLAGRLRGKPVPIFAAPDKDQERGEPLPSAAPYAHDDAA